MSEAAPKKRLSLPLRVLAALLPLLLMLALAEAALWVAGVGGDESLLDVSRGFDASGTYVLPDPERPGGFRTNIFGDSPVEEIVVPPKGEATRVVLFGGSNTQTFPEFVLAEALDEQAPGQPFEVLNLGRAGYGSERVRILFEQALVLQPDIVVIYSGHNEFVEAGFQLELKQQWGGAGVLAETLGQLRLFRVLSESLGEADADPLAAAAPPTLDRQYESFRHTTWAETQRYFKAYELNLESICATAAEHGVTVVLCSVVWNGMAPPHISTLPADLDTPTLNAYRKLEREFDSDLDPTWFAGIRPPARLRLSSWYNGGAGERATPVLRRMRGGLAQAEAYPPKDEVVNGRYSARDRKSVSLDGAHWPPPELWDTETHDLMVTMEHLVQRQPDEAQRAELQRRLGLLDEMSALVPDQPDVLFLSGLIHWVLGDDDAAAVALMDRGAALDRAPRKGNPTSNGAVRRVAGRHDEVLFFDASRLARQWCPDRLVGYEVMMDHCHLQPGARVALMRRLADEVLAAASRRAGG